MAEGPDLAKSATAAVEAALAAGAVDAEAYVQDSTGREIRVHGGKVESLTEATERGIGVRAWIDGKVGYAYATDFGVEALRDLGAGAAEAARIADADEFAAPPETNGPVPSVEGLRDPAISNWSTAQKVELALAVEAAALAHDPRVHTVEQAVYADEDGRVAIASSRGAEGEYEASSCYAYAHALAGEGAELQTGLGFDVGRSPAALDATAIGAEAGGRAADQLGAVKPDSRACPVVLDPTVAASFVSYIGGTLAADAVQRGRSPLAGRLGESIAGERLQLTDDGLDPDGLATAPFDDEGTPRRRTPLIESGRLRAYLHDAYTARRGGEAPTGNASRAGYRSAPSVSASNLVVGPGEDDLDGLLAGAGDGVYVTDVAGLHSGVNPISGVFSVGASGRRIAAGALAEPLREFTIASDLLSMLTAIEATGSEPRWVPFGGSVKTPALLIGEMTISGS
jgi:PmbA protein